MPISYQFAIEKNSQEEFKCLDYIVMGHAFESQKDIGRLADERIYQADLANRLLDRGFQVDREFEIILSHESFTKSLFPDLLIERKAIYEIKVANSLVEAHRGQLLNYLFLLRSERGKLINFGKDKVESAFVNNAITSDSFFRVDHSSFRGPSDFLKLVSGLIEDWGTTLSTELYREAATHLLGGQNNVHCMLPLQRHNKVLGRQSFLLCAPNEAFQITSLQKNLDGYRNHLMRLLRLSSLECIHWINLGYQEVKITTLQN